jgi:hypothetical protein
MQLEYKKRLAKNLASIEEGEAGELNKEQSEYFDKIFGKT